MFEITARLPMNREPWVQSLELRKKTVLNSCRNGKRIALYVYEKADTSTFRYRCYNTFQASMNSEQWQAVYFYGNETDDVINLLSETSLLVLTRVRWTHDMERLVLEAGKRNIPVYYDIDDYVCDVDALKIVTNTLNVHFGGEVDYDFWFAYISRMQKMASLADGFLTTNHYLGKKLSDKFNRPYQIIINSLNKEQIEVSEECFQKKQKSSSKKPYTIGYFSGTPSHINDFKIVSNELIQLLNDCPDMRLEVVGFMEFPDSMNSLMSQGRICFKPLVDFMELQVLMSKVDVSIVPLVNNSFTNCKSELKFFEAAVVGTPTIATPIFTYNSSISDNYTGFLCNPGQWYDTIMNLYSDSAVSGKIASNAREYALSQYCGESFVNILEKAYNNAINS